MAAEWTNVELVLPHTASETAIEALCQALFARGASGFETRDQALPVVLVACFPPEVPRDSILGRVEEAQTDSGVAAEQVAFKAVESIDWETQWRQHSRPMGFGRLWIVPTWLEVPKEADLVLRLDPGMAFGTGSHETTALCLGKIIELSPIASMLDVGCGTGILALAALRAGAGRAVGTDNDPEALRVARENAEQNGLLSLVLSDKNPDQLQERFSVVVANILSETLIALAPKLVRALEPAGRLVLSGILQPQVEGVVAAYRRLGLGSAQIQCRGEWALIELWAPAATPP